MTYEASRWFKQRNPTFELPRFSGSVALIVLIEFEEISQISFVSSSVPIIGLCKILKFVVLFQNAVHRDESRTKGHKLLVRDVCNHFKQCSRKEAAP